MGMAIRWLSRSIQTSIQDWSEFLLRVYARVFMLVQLHRWFISPTLPSDIRQVLFVCKGNVCRSPLAAKYFEGRAIDRKNKIKVSSAGLETTPGKEAHPLAIAVAEKYGLSLGEHSTTLLSRDHVDQSDLILVMEFAHRSRLIRFYPEARPKVFPLAYFGEKKWVDIEDPYNGTIKDFETCYQIIRQSCDNLLQRIAESDPEVQGSSSVP